LRRRFFVTPAAAEEPADSPVSIPDIPADVLEITGEQPFIDLLYYETGARGAEALMRLSAYGYYRDQIADELLQLGFNVTPRGYYQSLQLPPVPEESSQTALSGVTDSEAAAFSLQLNSMLSGLGSPDSVAAAQALEARIVGEVESWLAKFRAQVDRMKADTSPPARPCRHPRQGTPHRTRNLRLSEHRPYARRSDAP
jgi:hypothetical protein